MGRSGYSDDWDGDDAPPAFYRQAVERSIDGKRGQSFLRELAKEMDAMPIKALIAEDLVTPEGQCCALGVVCKARGIDVSKIDETDPECVADALGVAPAMAREIAYLNDDDFGYEGSRTRAKEEDPEKRWIRMRKWVAERLSKTV